MINFSPVLIVLLLVGIFISIKDYKKGIIDNKHIIILIALGLIFQLLEKNLLAQPLRILGIFAFGGAVSFFLWFIGIFPAGDSKLFTSLFLYFPMEIYSRSLVLDFLTNIFVPVFLFLAIYLLIKSDKNLIVQSIKKSFGLYRLGMLFVIFVGFAWFIYAPLAVLGLDLGYFGLVIFLFLGYELLLKLSSGRTELTFIILAVARIVIDFQYAFTPEFLLNTIIIVTVFAIFRFFFLSLSFESFSVDKKIDDLEPGLKPAEVIEKTEGKFVKKPAVNSSLVGYLADAMEERKIGVEQLTEKDIAELEKLVENEKLESEELKIFRKQHFSSFIFVGYFLTFTLGMGFPEFLGLFI